MSGEKTKVLLEVEIEEAWSEGYLKDPEVLEQHLTGGLQGITVKAIKSNDSEVDITKPLRLSRLVIEPIDEDRDFVVESSDSRVDEFYTYMSIEEAQQVIDYLTKSINEREQLKQ